MRVSFFAAIAVVSLAATFSGSIAASAQSDESTPHKKIFGYQDAETGTFHAMNHVVAEAATTPITGTIELTIDITLKTALPTGGTILCSASLTASSTVLTTGMSTFYEEEASSVATASGSTHTCTVNVPYSWLLAAPSSTVSNSLVGDYAVEMANLTGKLPALVRSSSSTFLNVTKIPATGTITKATVNVTL
jgi:hypothetical protein